MECKIHEVEPREQSGRDSFSRYKAQVRSAAIAALAILEGKQIDRVYCDLHDDFVLRKVADGKTLYTFFQVKTKGKKNYQWTINDTIGLKKRVRDQSKQSTEDIRDSFIGKLLSHTVTFGVACEAVVFQTNIHVDDDVEKILVSIQTGEFDNPHAVLIIERFRPCFDSADHHGYTCIDLIANVQKLRFDADVHYLKDDGDFEPIAREAIYRYSEVDLEHAEASEIVHKLLALVERKSSGVINDITESSIEELAGISISDLLPILSISVEAYDSLITGGDLKAIKSASIIQRALSRAGAADDQIQYCSRCKTQWDIWYRKNRHVLSELDMNAIAECVSGLANDGGSLASVRLSDMRSKIRTLIGNLREKELLYDMDENLILGGFFAEIVRRKS